MSNNYSFIQYSDKIRLPNGIYNGLYNREPAIIRIKDGLPVYVQFIEKSAIFDARGILYSSVEILLPAQEFEFQKFVESI
jgi:hypothetical protein